MFSSGTALPTQDDPYYHLAHALAYERGEDMRLPLYSTLSERPGLDLYLWYHRALAPLTHLFGDDAPAEIMGSKLFHALGTALFFSVFFHVLVALLADTGNIPQRRRVQIALLATLALYALSPLFAYRILLLRPHVFTASVMLLSVYSLLTRRHLLLFALAFLFPLFYSASFLFLLPVGIYTIAAAWYSRAPLTRPALYRPCVVTIAGLTAGTLAHPDPYGHFFNGTIVHLATLFNRFGAKQILEGGELYAHPLLPWEALWLIPFLTVVTWLIARSASRQPWRERVTFREWYLALLASVFVAFTVFINRAAEYAVPFALLALVVVSWRRLPAAVLAEWARLQSVARAAPLAAAMVAVGEAFLPRWRLMRDIALTTGALFFFATLANAALASYRHSGDELAYRGAALYMAAHSEQDALVFHSEFSHYPRLVFWNTHNRYVSGMGDTFTYLYSERLFWLMRHIGAGGPVCPRRKCKEGDADLLDPYEVLARDIGATFVFIDTSTPAFDRRELELFEHDPRFKLVFTDPEFEAVKVFRVGGGDVL